jgi:glucose/arabinose dehydrogenase
VRYRVLASNPDLVDPDSATKLLSIKKPEDQHNGGLALFGPDGYLYVGVGDGGNFQDRFRLAQKRDGLLGKLLRLDVDSGAPYAIPKDNPFANDPAYAPEIWALGLRNPWRFSFDRSSGDLFIADVGEKDREEIEFQPAGRGGQNHGWSFMEGTLCVKKSDCGAGSYVAPVFEYSHAEGCAIVGGSVYRGPAFRISPASTSSAISARDRCGRCDARRAANGAASSL